MSVTLYRRYRAALRLVPPDGRIMPYEWTRLPTPRSLTWLLYGEMLDEFARELANTINDFTLNVDRLRAWAEVLPTLSDKQKADACHEFIDALATLTVNLPYVVKSRFIFATAHLSHQANMVHDRAAWLDDLPPDHRINIADANARGQRWTTYPTLKQSLEGLFGKAFRDATREFRHTYNHRFSPRFVIGLTQMVRRRVDPATGRISYALGGLKPLPLEVIAEFSARERNQAYGAFEAFQALIHEQSDAIAQFEGLATCIGGKHRALSTG
jgi:hypothetical protein